MVCIFQLCSWTIVYLEHCRIIYRFEYDTIQHKLSITGKDSLSKDPTFFQQHQNDVEFISIGNGFTIIEESAFSDYTSLKRIILPEGLKTITSSHHFVFFLHVKYLCYI